MADATGSRGLGLIGQGLVGPGPIVRRLRLASGLVLFTYVLTHLLNHALGNAGIPAMAAALVAQKWIWQGWIGTALLYGALSLHMGLGFWALYERRYFFWTGLEMTQLVLGLAIPPLLANHVTVTRLALVGFGLDKGYEQELYALWAAGTGWGIVQVIVLVVAWVHGCIGLRASMRLRPWYGRARSLLLAAAILLPVLALLGYVQGGRELVRDLAVPGWRAANFPVTVTGTQAQIAWLACVRDLFWMADAAALALVLAARGWRAARERRAGTLTVTYPDGRLVRAPHGLSVLDISRLGGVRHASVCGGRGRCSTCRVRVDCQSRHVPAPTASECAVLAQVGADPAQIRLACQLRPRGDIGVAPLISPEVAEAFVAGRRRAWVGEERFVVAMFIDMRGSSRLVQRQMPFDSVFLIARFVDAIAAAVAEAGGAPNQFTGDGILDLFQGGGDPRTACRQALAACAGVARALARLDAHPGGEAIGYGIGVQCGPAVLGEISFRGQANFTAIGDVVHVASRLQDQSRDFGCPALIAADVVRLAGLRAPASITLRQVALRGRTGFIAAYAASSAALLALPA